MIQDLIVLISENQHIFLKITKCSRKDKKFQAYHGILSDNHGERDFTGENRVSQERMEFYGKERDFTGENGISRKRTGFHGRGTVMHGREWERMEFHGIERYFTGENGISWGRTGFYGRER